MPLQGVTRKVYLQIHTATDNPFVQISIYTCKHTQDKYNNLLNFVNFVDF